MYRTKQTQNNSDLHISLCSNHLEQSNLLYDQGKVEQSALRLIRAQTFTSRCLQHFTYDKAKLDFARLHDIETLSTWWRSSNDSRLAELVDQIFSLFLKSNNRQISISEIALLGAPQDSSLRQDFLARIFDSLIVQSSISLPSLHALASFFKRAPEVATSEKVTTVMHMINKYFISSYEQSATAEKLYLLREMQHLFDAFTDAHIEGIMTSSLQLDFPVTMNHPELDIQLKLTKQSLLMLSSRGNKGSVHALKELKRILYGQKLLGDCLSADQSAEICALIKELPYSSNEAERWYEQSRFCQALIEEKETDTLKKLIDSWRTQCAYEQVVAEESEQKLPFASFGAIALSEDALLLAENSNSTSLISLQEKHRKLAIHQHNDQLSGIALNAHFAASSDSSGMVYVSSIKSGSISPFTSFKHHTAVTAISISLDGQLLATSTQDSIRVWDLYNKTCQQIIPCPSVMSMVFSPDRSCLISGDLDGQIALWTVSDGQMLCTFSEHWRAITALAFSANRHLFASGSDDCQIKIWNMTMSSCLQSLQEHDAGVTAVVFSQHSVFLVSSSIDQSIRIWSTAAGKCLQKIITNASWPIALALGADTLTVSTNKRQLYLWKSSEETFDKPSPSAELIAAIALSLKPLLTEEEEHLMSLLVELFIANPTTGEFISPVPLIYLQQNGQKFLDQLRNRELPRTHRILLKYPALSPLPLYRTAPTSNHLFEEAYKIVCQQSLSWKLSSYRQARLDQYRKEVPFYVPLKAGVGFSAITASDLSEQLLDFLDSKQRILLLQGNAGGGKSTFCRSFEYDLWIQYPAGKVPLYFPLFSVGQSTEDLIDELLSKRGFCSLSKEQIDKLKEEQVLFILDGYDELKSSRRHIQWHELLDKWPRAQFMITCRSEFLTMSNYNRLFTPATEGVFHYGQMRELYIQPFTIDQVDEYIDLFVRQQNNRGLNSSEYKRRVRDLPSELLSTPFLVYLTVDTLPELSSASSLDQRLLTRAEIYRSFVNKWFERSDARLRNIQHSRMSLLENTTHKFARFCRNLAHEMVKRNQVEVAWSAEDEEELLDVNPEDWRLKFFARDQQQILSGCPLLRKDGEVYTFLHLSLLEYFVADKILKNLPNSLALLEERIYTDKIVLLSFIADRVVSDRRISEELFNMVQSSKGPTERHVQIGATNAITILSLAKENFSGRDLHGIRVEGACLDQTLFQFAHLEGADLSNCSLQGSLLSGANLRGANLQGVLLDSIAIKSEQRALRGIDFAPDGLKIASGGKDKTLNIWNAASGDLIAHWRTKTDITDVAFSPDGRSLASGTQEGEVHLWNVENTPSNLQPTQSLNHGDEVAIVAFSKDGAQIASAGKKKVKWWSIDEAMNKHTFNHSGNVTSIVFSSDVSHLAAGEDSGQVHIWDLAEKKSILLEGHRQEVLCVELSASGMILMSGSVDKSIRVWDIAAKSRILTLWGHSGAVTALSLASDDKRLASSSYDGTVRLWDVVSGTQLEVLQGHQDIVHSVVFSPSGAFVASASEDKTLQVWGVTESKYRYSGKHNSPVLGVSFSRDSSLCASASEDHAVKVWTVNQGKQLFDLRKHEQGVTAIAFNPSGTQIASGSKDHTIRLWKVSSGQQRLVIKGHRDAILSLSFAADGSLASGSSDSTIRIWDSSTGEKKILIWEEVEITSLSFAMKDQLIAAPGKENKIKLWEVTNGNLLFQLDGHRGLVTAVHATPTGNFLVSSSLDKSIIVWDLSTRKQVRVIKRKKEVTSLVLSSRGEQLLSGSEDGRVHLWDIRNGKKLSTFRGHREKVNQVAISANDRFIASVSDDHSIRVWKKAENGTVPYLIDWVSPARFECHEADITSASISKAVREVLLQGGAKGKKTNF